MSRFTPETIERVREAADIVEVVSAHTDLRRQGERFTGLCPFHEERTPSFSVKPAEGFYYCFGCEAGGDTIRFVQEKEGLSFPDAVEALAERYGVEVERETEDPKAEEARRRRGRLGDALQRAATFYANYLWDSDKALKARRYLLEERGLGEEVLRAFGVGFAPSAWDTIYKRGQISGFSVDELLAAGLIQRSQKSPGGHYDRFRARITFPVRDHRGRVVGFGARGMGTDAKPKYLNSPENEVYRKSRTLYGIDRARGPIARGSRAVVVEGYTDVLALHQAGIEEAVAVMGTAITPEQLKLLGGYAEEVVLALDADRAGREAMLRAQRVAGSGRLRLLVAAMPAGEDPADMLRSEAGASRLRELIADAIDLAAFHVRAILDDADLSTPAGRDRALDEAAPVLVAMGETITRQEMVREVGDRLDAAPELVAARMRAGGRRGRPESEPAAAPVATAPAPSRPRREPTQEERREAMMLALCLDAPEAAGPYLERLGDDHFSSPVLRAAFERIRERPGDPLEGLGEADSALINAISRLRAVEHEPPTRENLEFRWMLLEHDRLGRALRHGSALEPAELVAMQKERGRLSDAISSAEQRFGGAVPGPTAT
ncbi:MAG: DNA primase [Acidobacteria bacterium]|nr:MAG: DNA primase [Acidobacteriota bacterium]MCL4286807.1 DNA primase [Thermoleophilia bacterium]GIK77413.1 MAG: DNA primase [Actinomycetes bacterium]